MSENSTYILCIETANAITSVAVSKDGICLHSKEVLETNKAADTLHILTEQLLSESNLLFSNLHAIAISAGPGSYTGLRIAAAAAKGFCFVLDIPLIAVSTLKAMVFGIQNRYHYTGFDEYVPMIDARRMEVFTSFFSEDLATVQFLPNLLIDQDSQNLFNAEKKYLLFGNGAKKAKNYLPADTIRLDEDFRPSAKDLCFLAFSSYRKQHFEDTAYFEPNYSKAFYTTSAK